MPMDDDVPLVDDEEEAYSEDGFEVPIDQTQENQEIAVSPQVNVAKESNFRTVVPIDVKNEINHPNFIAQQ